MREKNCSRRSKSCMEYTSRILPRILKQKSMTYKKINHTNLKSNNKITAYLSEITSKLPLKKVIIFTLYRDLDQTINIGYTYKLEDLYKNYIDKGYTLIAKSYGSRNQYKIIKQALLEIGYNQDKEYKSYNYSIYLLKYLNILGWPTGNEKNINRLKKYC